MKSSLNLRPNGWDGIVIAVILAAIVGLGAYFWQLGQAGGDLVAILSVDGQEQERIALSDLPGEEERIVTANGYTLHVHFSQEGVAVDQADCPTQDCVHTGTVSRGGQSIVCLPARVVVTLRGESDDGVDVVVG